MCAGGLGRPPGQTRLGLCRPPAVCGTYLTLRASCLQVSVGSSLGGSAAALGWGRAQCGVPRHGGQRGLLDVPFHGRGDPMCVESLSDPFVRSSVPCDALVLIGFGVGVFPPPARVALSGGLPCAGCVPVHRPAGVVLLVAGRVHESDGSSWYSSSLQLLNGTTSL